MKTVKLNIELTLPDNALVVDVTALIAAWKFVLRGFFPDAHIRTEIPCSKPTTSTAPEAPRLLS